MNVEIRDRSVFESLNPSDVTAYLVSAGWKAVDNRPGHSSLFRTVFERKSVELLVPLNRQFKDYVDRMAETVPMIAAIEKRSELEVLSDIQTVNSDVVRIRCKYASAHDGSIPLERGEKLVEKTRELFTAGGRAVGIKRANYGNRASEQLSEYIRKLRLGQSERGSYVFKVLSPVAPELKPTGHFPGTEPEPEQPYERLAVAQLNTALVTLRAAADEAMTTPQMDVFDRAVEKGVSSNLCSALIGIGGNDPQPNDELAISFTWARTRTPPSETVREIIFPGDRFAIITEAVRHYKGRVEPEETTITGYVVGLQSRNQGQLPAGPIRVVNLGGGPKTVMITLAQTEHDRAIQAYKTGSQITCRGTLAQHSGGWILQDPGRVIVLQDESTFDASQVNSDVI